MGNRRPKQCRNIAFITTSVRFNLIMTYFLVRGDPHRPKLIFLKLDEKLSNDLLTTSVAISLVTDGQTDGRICHRDRQNIAEQCSSKYMIHRYQF